MRAWGLLGVGLLAAGCGVETTSSLLSCPEGTVSRRGRCEAPTGAIRPVVVTPSLVDFGEVPVGGAFAATVEVTNPNPMAVEVTISGVSAPFSSATDTLFVPAEGSTRLQLRYSARAEGVDRAEVRLDACAGACPTPLSLRGRATDPSGALACAVERFNVPPGECQFGFATCENLGDVEVVVSRAQLEPPTREFSLSSRGPLFFPPGGAQALELIFCPSQPGTFSTELVLYHQDSDRITRTRVEGAGDEAPRCQLDVSPVLDFEVVVEGQAAQRELFVYNFGRSACGVRSEGFERGASPELSAEPFDTTIQSGDGASLRVTLAPSPVGRYSGRLRLVDELSETRIIDVRARVQRAADPLVVSSSPAGMPPELPQGLPAPWNGGADDGFFTVELPFAFTLFGEPVEALTVSANGGVTFSRQNIGLDNSTFPQPGEPNHMIAWWWDDIDPSQSRGQGVRYQLTTDEVGQGVLHVHFDRVPNYGASNGRALTAMISLYEAGSRVVVHYGDLEPGSPSNQGASVGWEGPLGLVGANVLPCTPNCRFNDWPRNSIFTYRDAP